MKEPMDFTICTPYGNAIISFDAKGIKTSLTGEGESVEFIGLMFEHAGFTGDHGIQVSLDSITPDSLARFCNSPENGLALIVPPEFEYPEDI